jgi:putative endopeptidase
MKNTLALLSAILLLAACQDQQKTPTPTKPDFLAADIDTTVSPGQDFFAFANGGWVKHTTIPPEENSWGIGFMVQEDIYNRLRTINEKAQTENAAKGTTSQKISDFWYSGMDSAEIDKQKLQPLQPDLDKINAIHSVADLLAEAGELHSKGAGVLFGAYVAQDDKNSDVEAFQLAQGGLGMPERAFYFNMDTNSIATRKAYSTYMMKTFMQLGSDSITAEKRAKDLMQLETKLAQHSRKLEDTRDPIKNYNKMSFGSLEKLSPGIAWTQFLKNTGIDHVDSVIVGQPEFFSYLGTALQGSSLETWKDYLRFQLIMDAAPYLDHETYNNHFAYVKALFGAQQPRPRWKRVLDAEEGAIGEALGQLFVKEYFDEKAKKRYSDLVEAIRDAYKERIQKLTWMSDSTKQKALTKLSEIGKKVGYPDKWKDFSALTIDRGPFVLNMQRASQWWHNRNIKRLGKPVDRTEWGMTPQTYNASYSPNKNEILLPAGIFIVPGMKDDDLDDGFVYGYAAASTIGHEITHGFDDQGRQYDDKGNMVNWWQPNDEKQFKQRADVIIDQFNHFNPVDTLHVNGNATQGENIADLGGMLIGLDAFKKTDSYKKGEKIGGYTPLQRYFLGYAYGWLYVERPKYLAAQLKMDVHAPSSTRVNGPVANVNEFYEAFNVKPGDKMYRPDSLRVKIW